MYIEWLFDSNQNKVTVIADYEFNSKWASNTITLLSSTVQRTQKHKHIFWGTELLESLQIEKTKPK